MFYARGCWRTMSSVIAPFSKLNTTGHRIPFHRIPTRVRLCAKEEDELCTTNCSCSVLVGPSPPVPVLSVLLSSGRRRGTNMSTITRCSVYLDTVSSTVVVVVSLPLPNVHFKFSSSEHIIHCTPASQQSQAHSYQPASQLAN